VPDANRPSYSKTNPNRVRWQVLVAAAILAILAVRALVVPLFAIKMIDYPIDFFIGEGDDLVYTIRLVRGESMYSNSSALPIMGNVYPPVFPWLASLLGRIVPPTLASMRVFAFIPLIGTMLLTALYLRGKKVRNAVVAAAVLLVPCCYSMSHFLIMSRCDSWAVLFCLGSLYFLDRENDSPRRWILGGLCSSLALFTKQTALFGLVLVHLTLLLKRRRAGAFASAAAAAGCFLLLGLSLWRFGPVFIEAITSLTARREFYAGRYVLLVQPLLALGVLVACAATRMGIHLGRRQWDLLDSFVAGHAVQTLLVFYLFSGTNYFLPFFAGVVLSSARLIDEWLNARLAAGRTSQAPVLGLCSALVVAQLCLQMPCENTLTPPDEAGMSEAHYAAQFLTGTNEPVYTERFWGCVAARESTDQYFVEPTHLRTLAPGRIMLSTLTARFEQKVFHRLMFYGHTFHPDGFLDVVLKEYRIVRKGFVPVCFDEAQSIPVYYLERK
jgi:hypothetical protein